MDPRDLVRSNAYSGSGLFSASQVYIDLVPGTNWVSSGPPSAIVLDPQVRGEARPHVAGQYADVDLQAELVKRRVRRKLMSDLTNEFAVWHDDLLRELAR